MPRIRAIAIVTILVEVLMLLRATMLMASGSASAKLVHYMALYGFMIAIMATALCMVTVYSKNKQANGRWAGVIAPLGSLLVLVWGAVFALLDLQDGSATIVYVALQYLIIFMFVLPPHMSLVLLLVVQAGFIAGLFAVLGAGSTHVSGVLINTSINTAFAWLISHVQYASAYRQHQTQRTIEAKSELLEILNQELEELSVTDPLTELMNRRSFDLVAMQEWHRALRDGVPITVAIVDVDHFKQYNDIYGHQMGDNCLRMVADSLRKNLRRASDIVARYGGEEFVIMLVGDEPWQARVVLERACRGIEELKLPHAGSSASPNVTISMGAFCAVPTVDASFDEMMRLADDGMYAAKNAGRNRFTWQDDGQNARPPLTLVANDK